MKTIIDALFTLITFCSFVITVSAQSIEGSTVHTSGNLNSDIDVLLKTEDFGTGEIDLLRNFTIQAIPVLTQRLNDTTNKSEEGMLMLLLSAKLEQFGSAVPALIKQPAIDSMVAKCRAATNSELRSKLAVLKNIDDPKIDRLIEDLAADHDDSKRQAAAIYKEGKKLTKHQ